MLKVVLFWTNILFFKVIFTLFCILLSPGRALVIEALHDVYDYHQWDLPLHQVKKGSSVFASAVAGGKFSFILVFFLIWIEICKKFCQMLGVQLSYCLRLRCKVDGRQGNVKFSHVSLSGFFCIQVWRNLKWSCMFSKNLPLKVLLRLFLHFIGTFCNIYTNLVVFIFLCRSFIRVICFHKHNISLLIQKMHFITFTISNIHVAFLCDKKSSWYMHKTTYIIQCCIHGRI